MSVNPVDPTVALMESDGNSSIPTETTAIENVNQPLSDEAAESGASEGVLELGDNVEGSGPVADSVAGAGGMQAVIAMLNSLLEVLSQLILQLTAGGAAGGGGTVPPVKGEDPSQVGGKKGGIESPVKDAEVDGKDGDAEQKGDVSKMSAEERREARRARWEERMKEREANRKECLEHREARAEESKEQREAHRKEREAYLKEKFADRDWGARGRGWGRGHSIHQDCKHGVDQIDRDHQKDTAVEQAKDGTDVGGLNGDDPVKTKIHDKGGPDIPPPGFVEGAGDTTPSGSEEIPAEETSSGDEAVGVEIATGDELLPPAGDGEIIPLPEDPTLAEA